MTELNRVKEERKSIVDKRASASTTAAVIPDSGADVVIISELLPAINKRFGLYPEQIDQMDAAIKGKIAVIIFSIGSELVGMYITKQTVIMLLKKVGARVAVRQITKYIPFIRKSISTGISFGVMKFLENSI